MEDRETPRMRNYGESKTARIMMASVPHVTSGSGLRKFQADGFLFDGVYLCNLYRSVENQYHNKTHSTDLIILTTLQKASF